jgi:hypothetical protein
MSKYKFNAANTYSSILIAYLCLPPKYMQAGFEGKKGKNTTEKKNMSANTIVLSKVVQEHK